MSPSSLLKTSKLEISHLFVLFIPSFVLSFLPRYQSLTVRTDAMFLFNLFFLRLKLELFNLDGCNEKSRYYAKLIRSCQIL